jgi:hypothetical protein
MHNCGHNVDGLVHEAEGMKQFIKEFLVGAVAATAWVSSLMAFLLLLYSK